MVDIANAGAAATLATAPTAFETFGWSCRCCRCRGLSHECRNGEYVCVCTVGGRGETTECVCDAGQGQWWCSLGQCRRRRGGGCQFLLWLWQRSLGRSGHVQQRNPRRHNACVSLTPRRSQSWFLSVERSSGNFRQNWEGCMEYGIWNEYIVHIVRFISDST